MPTSPPRARLALTSNLLAGVSLAAAALLPACSSVVQLGACDDGFALCEGTCIDVSSDAANCGGCGHACGPTQVCDGGACAATCSGGLTPCGGACVDLLDDPQHCGGCGHACGPAASCSGGVCQGCPENLTQCGGVCVDLLTDSQHCGGCGIACGPAAPCFDGVCQGDCPAGLINCGGVCVDPSSDPQNCGGCGLACGGPCVAGACASCPSVILGGAVPQTVTGTTVGSSDFASASCAAPGGPDVSYLFTAPTAGVYGFDTQGSAFDTVLHVRGGGCAGPEIACNDNAGASATSQVSVQLVQGQQVVVFVDGAGGDQGDYALHVTQAMAPQCPANDLGSTVPQSVTGSTTGLAAALSASCGGGASGPEDTYRFTAPVAGSYTFDTFGSVFDTVLHVHNGGCQGVELACNDDSMGLTSQVTVQLAAGQSVTAVVDGFGTESGAYALHVTQPGSSLCPGADLGSTVPQTVTGSTVGLPNNLVPGCAPGGTAPDATFRFTAPATATYVFNTVGSLFDTVLSVRDGTCAGAELACNDDSGGVHSVVILSLAAGQTVVVSVDGFGAASGNFTLHIATM